MMIYNILADMRAQLNNQDCVYACLGPCVYLYIDLDLSKANLNDANLEKMNPVDIPDVVRGDAFHVYFCC